VLRPAALLAVAVSAMTMASQSPRPRLREAGIVIGELPAGRLNAITDVPGVRVGHTTVIDRDWVRTGVTIVLPHGGNLFQEKVPAAIAVANGFGKLVGATQVQELGELESPIALTGTLNVHRVADALLSWMLEQPGNTEVRSLNVVVGETNDGGLNDVRGRHVDEAHVREALRTASDGAVAEGSVGAGTGTRCFGFKGGIGTASRQVRLDAATAYLVGVLVQTNFGGRLRLNGREVPQAVLGGEPAPREREGGSCMIVLATDAPLDARNLQRLAERCFAGMARTGASFSNGSGDYAIAFSTATVLRQRTDNPSPTVGAAVLRNDKLSPLFIAAAEATEEAILNSLFKATPIASRVGRAEALPLPKLLEWWNKR
jgi:D-aminopeptidase